ncbi:MAG TPA: TauD/TfdA family dioxygenase [Candidatus Sulfotelmatobacter sp.]|jgi:taurine dioxygenase|nr:TauD/TfdA family dioxygenase [Candidatus Sulfotelmatobacter sp.]
MSFYRDFNDKRAIEAWNSAPREAYRTIQVKRLTPTIGAEVRGIDLSKDLSDEQFGEIRRAISENLVLAFRDQDISPEDHKRFARRFGSLHSHVLGGARALSSDKYDPEVLAWRTDQNSRNTAGDAWHNDVSCDAHPIWGSFLRVRELPEGGGGDTAFANLQLAYDSLSDPIKALLDGLTAIHDGSQAWTAGYGAQPSPGTSFPASEHPVVARHPVTGRKFLFVNPSFTSHIVQLTRPESAAVLKLIYDHVSSNLAFQTRIHWEPNTLLFWDNWATWHHAIWDYYPNARWGERVSAYLDHGPQA